MRPSSQRTRLHLLAMAALFIAAAAIGGCRRTAPRDGIDLLVGPIDTTITLGAWRASHPADSVPFDSIISDRDPFLCRHARATLTVAGVLMQRIATFDVPNEPAQFASIDDTTRFAERTCRLTGVTLRYEDGDSLRVAAIADSVRRLYRAASRDSSHVVEVYPALDEVNPETGGHTMHAHLMLASNAATPRATGDVRDFTGDNAIGRDVDAASLANDHLFDSALAHVSIPYLANALRTIDDYTKPLLRDHRTVPDSLRTTTLDSLVAHIVRVARDSAPHLATSRKAALLLATDLAINAYAGSLSDEPKDTTARRTYTTLSAAGVPYIDSHLGSEYVYDRQWLFDAYAADSAGPIGRMLIVPLLAQGWGADVACLRGGGGSGAPTVIAHGEAALAAGATDPMIHFLVGEAYMDDVAMSQGALADYSEPGDFTAAAKRSRPKAIAHFLAALRGLHDDTFKRKAWIYAMRLMVGARTTTTFVCIND